MVDSQEQPWVLHGKDPSKKTGSQPYRELGTSGSAKANFDLLTFLSCFAFPPPPAVLSEEDKRATTNVQNGLVLFFLVLFSSL